MSTPTQPPPRNPGAQPGPPRPKAPRGRYQFSLASLLMLMVLFSVLAAALGGMIRSTYGDSPLPVGYLVIMAIAAPMGVLIVVSLLRLGLQWLGRRQR